MDDHVRERLSEHGIRPTRQRCALAALLLDGPPRHVTAEAVHSEANAVGADVSLGTVYNTLRQLVRAGLLREIAVDAGRTWFDTCTDPHAHLFHEDTGELVDAPPGVLTSLPAPRLPAALELVATDVVLRVRRVA